METIKVNGDKVYNSLKAVNNGELIMVNIPDPIIRNSNLELEVLDHRKNNKECDVLVYYFWDKSKNKKMALTICRNINTGELLSELYFYKEKESAHHYFSKTYKNFDGLNEKYRDIINYIMPVFNELFK